MSEEVLRAGKFPDLSLQRPNCFFVDEESASRESHWRSEHCGEIQKKVLDREGTSLSGKDKTIMLPLQINRQKVGQSNYGTTPECKTNDVTDVP